MKYFLSKDCGEMNRMAMDKRIVGGIPAEAGEFPWQVGNILSMKKNKNPLVLLIGCHPLW